MHALRIGWVSLALIGCQQGEPEDIVESPIVNSSSPYTGPAVDNPALYPALVAHGRLPEGAFTDVSQNWGHSASFTDGFNLAAPPATDALSSKDKRGAWADGLATIGDAPYLEAPAFPSRLHDAVDSADARLGALSTTALDDAASVFSVIPGFSHDPPAVGQQFTSWTPPRARWLVAQWHSPPSPALPYPEQRYLYPTPYGLGAAPERGARLYCAAREVARHQHAGSLGEQVLLPLSILGQSLDIGVVEPSAFIDTPEKFTAGTTSDGAQAFNVPLVLGATITPIRPLLPSLPELRFPLVLTTGDGEIETNVGKQVIVEPQHCVITPWGRICSPIPVVDYRYRYKTLAHADAATVANASVTAHAQFPVFWAGPLLVELALDFGAAVGTTVPRVGVYASIPARATVGDDRVLSLAVPPAGWPTSPLRHGETSSPYLDGYWRLGQSYVPGDAATEVFDVRNFDGSSDTHAGTVSLTPTTALRAQVTADDDHHVAPTSELALAGTIHSSIGFTAGPASIEIAADGTISGALGIAHDVRDAVYAITSLVSPEPIAAVTVTPTGYGNVDLELKVGFHLHIPLPLVPDIDVSYDLVDTTVPLASFESPWDEPHRLRIGTESTLGEATQSPQVDSHIAADPPFPSFPPSMPSVAACLVDPSPVPPPPPPCTSTPVSGTPARVESCIYRPISIQIDPCMNIPAVTPDSDDATKCLNAELTYLCSPVSQEQWFGGQYVLAHKLTLDPDHTIDPPDLLAMIDIATKCSAADKASIPPGPDGPSIWFKSRYTVASCDAGATLHDAGDVITTTGPSDVHAGTCH